MYSHQRSSPHHARGSSRVPPPPPPSTATHERSPRYSHQPQQTYYNGDMPYLSLYHHQQKDQRPPSSQTSQLQDTSSAMAQQHAQHSRFDDTTGASSSLITSDMPVQSMIQKLDGEIQVLRERLQRGGIVNQHTLSSRLALVETHVQHEADDLKAFKQKVMRHLRDISERITDISAGRTQDTSQSQAAFSYSHNPLVLSPGEQRAINRSRNRTYYSEDSSGATAFSPIQEQPPQQPINQNIEMDFVAQLRKNRENLENLTREFEQLRVVLTEFPFSHTQLSDLQHQLYNRILSVLDSWGELLQQEVNRNVVRSNQGIQEKISFLEQSLGQRVNALEKEYQTIRLIQNQYQFDMEDEEYMYQRNSRINDIEELFNRVQRLEDNQKQQHEEMLFRLSKLEHSVDKKLEAMFNYFRQSGASHKDMYQQTAAGAEAQSNEEEEEVVNQLRQSLGRPEEGERKIAENGNATELQQPRQPIGRVAQGANTVESNEADDGQPTMQGRNARVSLDTSQANPDATSQRSGTLGEHDSTLDAPSRQHETNKSSSMARADTNAPSAKNASRRSETQDGHDSSSTAHSDTNATNSQRSKAEYEHHSTPSLPGHQHQTNNSISSPRTDTFATNAKSEADAESDTQQDSKHKTPESTSEANKTATTIDMTFPSVSDSLEGQFQTGEPINDTPNGHGSSEATTHTHDTTAATTTTTATTAQERLKQLKERVGANDEEEKRKLESMTPEEQEEYHRKKEQERRHNERYKQTLKKGLKQYASANPLKPGSGRGSKRSGRFGK
eukprot:gb/GECG01009309.1/.p1 GENE.gb/GECG01009309.1/~~gb/GECG01009309.1/.p1  ORF type:complete len:785 (+),score=137.56 gb/GECG01009309.1/:1-2355(+)